MKSWYTIRARASGAEVLIYDEIGAYGVSAKGFLAELGALPDDAALDLRLNSPGGSVFDAVAIHNALKRHEGTVTVWIDGIADSAASYIAMAGDEIVMPENAFLMIHDPSGLVMGTAGDMRAMAEALEKVKGALVQGYAAKSGRTPDEVYGAPANLFVAQFVGSPVMNVLPATVTRGAEGAEVLLVGAPAPFLFPAALLDRIDGGEDGLALGIRPEGVAVSREARDGWLPLEAHIIEPLGSHDIVDLSIGDKYLRARVKSGFVPRPGEIVHVRIDPAQAHFFDRESGVSRGIRL